MDDMDITDEELKAIADLYCRASFPYGRSQGWHADQPIPDHEEGVFKADVECTYKQFKDTDRLPTNYICLLSIYRWGKWFGETKVRAEILNDVADKLEETALKTPDEWCEIKDIHVYDPDGWRFNYKVPDTDPLNHRDGVTRIRPKPWQAPISEAEFDFRVGMSTTRRRTREETATSATQTDERRPMDDQDWPRGLTGLLREYRRRLTEGEKLTDLVPEYLFKAYTLGTTQPSTGMVGKNRKLAVLVDPANVVMNGVGEVMMREYRIDVPDDWDTVSVRILDIDGAAVDLKQYGMVKTDHSVVIWTGVDMAGYRVVVHKYDARGHR